MIRVPPETHRRLAVEAAEAGVSLNRLASTNWRSSEAKWEKLRARRGPKRFLGHFLHRLSDGGSYES